jgi:hypothetical protein
MHFIRSFQEKILQNCSNENFESLALEAFHFQAVENEIYRSYLAYLKVDIPSVKLLEQIRFMPIEFFKSHHIVVGSFEPKAIFRSSGTTGQQNSAHWVSSLNFYHQNCTQIFNRFYGDISQYRIFALLPSYLERTDASLVNMMDDLIGKAKQGSGFYLNEYEILNKHIADSLREKTPTFIVGVTFALLEWAEKHPTNLNGAILIETGGMKGRRKEITKDELHQTLKSAFQITQVGSEYGMTELLSQGYATDGIHFETPPQLQVYLRDPNDPFDIDFTKQKRKTGAVNVIDLANVHSCCFIETKDLGRMTTQNQFEILGRMDNADIRGCNLMVQ